MNLGVLERELCYGAKRLNGSSECNRSLGFSDSFDHNFSVTLILDGLELVAPLDQQNASGFGAQIVNAQGHEFAFGIDTV